jgi:hypothetical protein
VHPDSGSDQQSPNHDGGKPPHFAGIDFAGDIADNADEHEYKACEDKKIIDFEVAECLEYVAHANAPSASTRAGLHGD